jgi:hypothetical protein
MNTSSSEAGRTSTDVTSPIACMICGRRSFASRYELASVHPRDPRCRPKERRHAANHVPAPLAAIVAAVPSLPWSTIHVRSPKFGRFFVCPATS